MDPRLRTAVTSSIAWYDDIFAVHGVPTEVQRGVWRSLGPPPRWHSAAKTVEPTAVRDEALRAVERFDRCSIADSFGVLDLSDAGFALLFEATWVHHAPLGPSTGALPGGWSVVRTEDDLEPWNAAHDTSDVLLPTLLSHPRFTFLGEKADGRLVAGAVLHETGGGALGISNLWVAAEHLLDPPALLACIAAVRPDRAVVGYEHGRVLEQLLGAGFDPVGPHRVWAR